MAFRSLCRLLPLGAPAISGCEPEFHSTNAVCCPIAFVLNRSDRNCLVRYSVKAKSPLLLLFPLATAIAAYVVPLETWVQIALLGIAGGAIGGYAGKTQIRRTFEPADAPLSTKRKVVVGFALARLVFGFFLILVSAAVFADWLSPAFLALGGYMAGSTIATPLSARELAEN